MAGNRYKKRSIVVEAFKMTKDNIVNYREWPDWLKCAWGKMRKEFGSIYRKNDNEEIHINTLEGEIKVNVDDWIICKVGGEIYPCKPEIFELSYDEFDVGVDITEVKDIKEKAKESKEFSLIARGARIEAIGFVFRSMRNMISNSSDDFIVVKAADVMIKLIELARAEDCGHGD